MLALLCVAVTIAFGDRAIETADDFVAFANDVNTGKSSFLGDTVTLFRDIDLAGVVLEPIGGNAATAAAGGFLGLFDGQGHRISGLNLTSDEEHVGLFGLSSTGMTVLNLVLDSSCAIEGRRGADKQKAEIHVGAIVGACLASERECSVRSSLSMAQMTFSGAANGHDFTLGGVVGGCFASGYRCSVANNANYGDVVFSGVQSGVNSAVGGIIGECDGYAKVVAACYVFNNVNYGAVKYAGNVTSKDASVLIGGVTGSGYLHAYLANNVNEGAVEASTAVAAVATIGGIAGALRNETVAFGNYWGPRTASFTMSGFADSSVQDYTNDRYDASYVLEDKVFLPQYEGRDLACALNAAVIYFAEHPLSQWAKNSAHCSLTFVTNGAASAKQTAIVLNDGILMFPTLASSKQREFDGWYLDVGLTQLFARSEVTENTTFYGAWLNQREQTITFNTTGGTPLEPIRAMYGSYIPLPRSTERPGYTIAAWVDTSTGARVPFRYRVPARDVTLRAEWAIAHITTPEHFAEFARVVNTGVFNYAEATVALDASLDLSDVSLTSTPVGTTHNPFKGTFEGNGHRLTNVFVHTAARHAGLFGYGTRGTFIRNLVLDASCAVESSYNASTDRPAYVAAVLGACTEESGCSVHNVISFATVTFAGAAPRATLYAGGVVGMCNSTGTRGCVITGCASRGLITVDGPAAELVIGGLVGRCDGNGTHGKCFISSSVSNAKIVVNEVEAEEEQQQQNTYNSITVGGVAGLVSGANVQLCASETLFSLPNSTVGGTVAGNAVGKVVVASVIGVHGACEAAPSPVGAEVNPSAVLNSECFDTHFAVAGAGANETVVGVLRRSSPAGTVWALNRGAHRIEYVVDGTAVFAENSSVILLPAFSGVPNATFKGWFTDKECQQHLFVEEEVTKDIRLYARWERSVSPDEDRNVLLSVVVTAAIIVGGLLVVALIVALVIVCVVIPRQKKNASDDQIRRALVEDELIF